MGGVVKAVSKVADVLGPIGGFLGPVGTIASAVSGANSLLGKDKPKAPAPVVAAQAPEFKPVKPVAVARPETLGEYAGFDQQQERSALATKGLNQGLGKDESSYYKNLVQRSLIGDDNKPAPDTNSLLPVESQYFSRQGMNTSGIMEFLKQLQGAQ